MKLQFRNWENENEEFCYTGKTISELYTKLKEDKEENLNTSCFELIENAICSSMALNSSYLLKNANVLTILAIAKGNILDYIDDDLGNEIIKNSINHIVNNEPETLALIFNMLEDVDNYGNKVYSIFYK